MSAVDSLFKDVLNTDSTFKTLCADFSFIDPLIGKDDLLRVFGDKLNKEEKSNG